MLISKIARGKGKSKSFGAPARYDLEKENAQFLGTNCASGDDWKGIASEMDTIAASSSSKNAIHHVSISSTEHLSDDQWREVADLYLKQMKLGNRQYLITRHSDTEHDHIHILVNKIGIEDGKCWASWQDANLAKEAMRLCENEMGLTHFDDHISQDAGRMTKLKSDLRDSVKEAHSNGKSHEALQQALNKRGYDLKLHSNAGGVYGASIQAHSDHKTWKLSELQKGGFKSVEKQLANGLSEATKSSKPKKLSTGTSQMTTSTPNRASSHITGDHRSIEGVTDKDLRDLIIRVNTNSGGIMQANLKGREQEL